MNLFYDFLKYFAAVVRGQRDPLNAFLEPLTMAERYLRWGRENGDPRDFRAGLDQLLLCVDEEAPIPNLLLRKYTTMNDLAAGGVELLLGRFEAGKREAEKQHEDTRFERINQEELVAGLQDSVDALTKDGSLLRAREEQKKLDEAKARLAFLRQRESEEDDLDELCDQYDQMAYDATRFFLFFDQAAASLPRCRKLPESTRESLIQQIRSRGESLRQRLDKADPIPAESAPNIAKKS